MTSLQEQLAKLAVPHVQYSLEGKKSSLLFESSEVQVIDKEVLYELAVTALNELCTINQTFKKYEDLLFQKSQINFDRTLQGQKFNSKLDDVLKKYLIELSPYYMMKSAQKTLEWLIHHYKIELFNTDDLIMTFLPYHQTNIFVRLLMMLNLEKPASKWHWLNGCAKNGIPLPKSLLLNQCKNDSGFLQSVFSIVDEYQNIMGKSNPNLSLVVDHCSVIGLLLLERSSDIKEEIVSTLMQYSLKGLKSKCHLREVACYPVIATLASRVSLKEEKVLKLTKMISKNFSEDFFTIAFHCLNILVSKQHHVNFKVNIFRNITFTDLQLYEIEEFSKKHPKSYFLKLLANADDNGIIKSILDKVQKDEKNEMDIEYTSESNENSFSLTSNDFLKCLNNEIYVENIKQYESKITDFLSQSKVDLENLKPIKTLIKEICENTKNLTDKSFEKKIEDIAKLEKLFSQYKSHMKYLSTLLLSDLFKRSLLANKNEKLVSLICNNLSKQIFRALNTNCNKIKNNENPEVKLYSSIDFTDSASTKEFYHKALLNFIELLKKYNIKYSYFESHNAIVNHIYTGMFCNPKKVLTKELVISILKTFDVNFLLKSYCCFLWQSEKLSLNNAHKFEYILNSRSWFVKLVKLEVKEIPNDIIVSLVLLLSHSDANVRTCIMSVLETYSSKQDEAFDFSDLFSKLFIFKDELLFDSGVLSQVLSSKFSSELTPGMQKLFDSFLQLIESGEFNIKYNLLKNMESCKNPRFISVVSTVSDESLQSLIKGTDTSENLKLYEACINCLSKNKKFIKSRSFYKLIIKMLEELPNMPKPIIGQVLQSTLANLTNFVYEVLSEEEKLFLVSSLVNNALSKELGMSKVFSDCLSNFSITYDVLEHLFEIKTKKLDEPLKKKKKVESKINLPKLTFILESLHSSEVMDTSARMCSLLSSILMNIDLSDNSDYTCQLLLTCLHKIIISLNSSEAKEYENCVNIEALVQCLRKTSNFQTQQHIVLVMTAISPLFPDQLLNNIISIFAFMGDNFVQKDDAYSFQLLTKLINVAIMVVVKLPANDPKKEASTINILRVFVDSRKHIPQHRLIPLLTQLLSVGTEEYLWKLIILIVESISLYKDDYKQKMAYEYDTIISLLSKYSVQIQLVSISSLIKFLITYLEALETNNKVSIEVIGPLVSKTTDTRFITLHLNKVVYNVLSDGGFHRNFLRTLEKGAEGFDGKIFQSIVNGLVQYILSINKKQKKIQHEMFWPALLKLVNLILKRVNYLIPASVFIDVVACLLSQKIQTVKNKGLELLYTKLDLIDQKEFNCEDYKEVIKLVPLLIDDVRKIYKDNEEHSQLFFMQQLSFLNLKILCKCYGNEDLKLFSELPELILKILQEESYNVAVIDSALFCLSEVVLLLKNKIVPYVNKLMKALSKLFERKEMFEKTISLDCLLSVFSKIISNFGQFISPFLDQLILQLCSLSADKVFLEKLNEKIIMIAKSVETRMLIPSLIKTYNKISSPNCYLPLFKLFKSHLENAKKEKLITNLKILNELICVLTNLRNDAVSLPKEEINELEDLYIEANLALVVHLSEVSFRPLLEKLYNGMEGDVARSVTFFHLMCAFSQKLKSIFNLFTGFLIKSIINLLNQHNESVKVDDEIVKKDDVTEEDSCLLICYLLRLITLCYTCDVEGAFSANTGDAFLVPVIDQLDNTKGDYEKRMENELIPCIVQLCQSIKDNNQLVSLNKFICYKCKNEDWRVRLAAVKCLKAVVESLGNLYEILFPETASYLSELLEDDKEEVAHHSRLFKTSIEKIIGNLENFF